MCCSHLENVAHCFFYVLVSGSHFSVSVWVLRVECRVWIRREMLLSYSSCAMLVRQWSLVLCQLWEVFLDDLPTSSSARWTPILRFLVSISVCSSAWRCARTWKSEHFFYEVDELDSSCDDGWDG